MNLFRHSRYRPIIQELIAEKRAHDKRFGYSALAKALRIQSTYISKVLKGERDFSSDQVYALSRFFELNQAEEEYLLLVLDCERTGIASRKRKLQRQIASIQVEQRDIAKASKGEMLSPQPTDLIAQYYLDPIVTLVHTFVSIPAYRNSPSLIAKRLSVPVARIEQILKQLTCQGVLRSTPSGYEVLRAHLHLRNDSPLYPQHQLLFRLLSDHHLLKLPKEERVSVNLTFCAEESTRVLVHESFLEFLRKVEPAIRAAENQEVYQLNFDLFPWSLKS